MKLQLIALHYNLLVCRSCLVSHIEGDNVKCPQCDTVIHHSYPLQYIAHDRTIQDIVEKLVPNLKES